MIIYMNLCKTKGVLGSWKLGFSYINENLKKKNRLVFGSFLPDFRFRAERKKVTSRPSQKSFSSSQLGSDSSLLCTRLYIRAHFGISHGWSSSYFSQKLVIDGHVFPLFNAALQVLFLDCVNLFIHPFPPSFPPLHL